MRHNDNKKKTYPVEPIRNSAIQMMADNMVNPIFVSKVTGITFSSIEALYYKSMEFQYEEYIDKNGEDYRVQVKEHPIEALQDRTKDDTCVGRC